MRVSNRNIYENINRRLSRIAGEMKRVNEQVTTGKRINRPSDDPIGITHAMTLKKALSQVGQYGRNIQFGQSWMTQTESSLQSIQTMIVRAKEIANQMSTGTYSDSQRQSAANEVENILGNLVQVGNTQLNGRYLFGGYQDDRAPFGEDLSVQAPEAGPGNDPAYTGTAVSSGAFSGVYSKRYLAEITTGGAVGVASYRVSEDGGASWGPNDAFTTSALGSPVWSSADQGVVIGFSDSGMLTAGDRFVIEVDRYRGDEEDIEVATGSGTQMKINLTGNRVFGEAGETEKNLFDILAGLREGLETNQVDLVQKSLNRLNGFQAGLGSNLADVGSRLNRMEMNQGLLSDLEANSTSRLAEVEDADAVKALTDFNAQQQIYEAALYAASRISNLSLVDYLK
jgi:flagellar hook-associated protein 3 FlgL